MSWIDDMYDMSHICVLIKDMTAVDGGNELD